MEKAGYKKGTIDKAVKEYDKNIHRFLPEVIKDIQSEFDLNVWIEKEEIRDRLAMIYKRHNILYTVKLNTIKEYFLVDETKDKKPYKYILKVLIKGLRDFLRLGYIKEKFSKKSRMSYFVCLDLDHVKKDMPTKSGVFFLNGLTSINTKWML